MLYFSRFKKFAIYGLLLCAIYFFIPNFININNSAVFSNKKVNLGLDLQGGSYLLLEIDSSPLLEQRYQIKSLEIRRKLRSEKLNYNNFVINKNKITFSYDLKDKDKILQILNSNEINQKINQTGKEFEININANIITLNFTTDLINLIKKNALEQSIEIVRNRVDEIGTKEPNIVTRGVDRVLVELPGLKDPSEIKKLLGKTAKLTFRFLSNQNAEDGMGSEVLSAANNRELKYNVERKIIISGENLIDAQPGFDQISNSSVVNFKLDNLGAKKFALSTKNNIGRNLAIILDNEVVSAPVIRDAIVTGNGQISGNFSVPEANNLAILLRSGALPAPLNIIEERTVGPDLGKDSIEKGVLSLIIGFILVVIYMVFNYRIFGLIANVSLIANLILIIAVLTLMGATLTLPGIAGIILTVGMAVDSNVLIYERIKEELKVENNNLIAFDTAYKKVLTTILDSNITTLIAAIVLYFIGTGPIKGFAVTLAVGIFSTFFTTYTFGRLLTSEYIKKRKNDLIKI